MTKWILPIACTILFTACANPMPGGSYPTSGASDTSGSNAPYGKHEVPPGTYSAVPPGPGTKNMPGGMGTPGTSVDPRAPGGATR